jgi:hypothetical protein
MTARQRQENEARFYPGRAARVRYNPGMSTIIAIIVIAICAWLAVKVVGFLFKGALVLVAFAVIYWLAAPHLGLPQPWL